MGGSVISSTKTTMGLDVPTPGTKDPYAIQPIPSVDQVSVYGAGQTAGPEVVIVDLMRLDKVRPVDGGGYTGRRTAAFALTRDEAVNFMRAIVRATGIEPLAILDHADAQYLKDALDWGASSAEAFIEAFDTTDDGSPEYPGLDIGAARDLYSGAAEMQARLDDVL